MARARHAHGTRTARARHAHRTFAARLQELLMQLGSRLEDGTTLRRRLEQAARAEEQVRPPSE